MGIQRELRLPDNMKSIFDARKAYDAIMGNRTSKILVEDKMVCELYSWCF